jgi:lipoate-protein ligase A
MSDAVWTKWKSARWTILPETVESPATHAALDEVLLDSVIHGTRGPTLRFWGWASPAVIIGRFQSLRNEVDSDNAARLGVTVVRRMSGGGAMYVRPDSTITYSLYVPDDMLAGLTIRDSYAFCDSWVVDTLRGLGADVTYQPLNDIASGEGKVGGAAQARRPGGVLHHTTIAWHMNGAEMLKVLRIGREKISDKGIASAAKRVHPLSEQLAMTREAVVAALIEHFRQRVTCHDGSLSREERIAAAELVGRRYGAPSWTLELP